MMMSTLPIYKLFNNVFILPMVELNKPIPLVHCRCFSDASPLPMDDSKKRISPSSALGIEKIVSLEVMLSRRVLVFDFDTASVKTERLTKSGRLSAVERALLDYEGIFKDLLGDSKSTCLKLKFCLVRLRNESSALLAPVADPAGVVGVKVMRSSSMAVKTRNFCSSGEGGSSDSSDSDTCFSERWVDHLDDCHKVASSLKEGGLVRDEHLKELKSVGHALVCTEIPDLDEVVNNAAQARIAKDGTDKAAAQVQNVLSNIEVARDAARLLEDETEVHLDKGPRKRVLPGEGEARASQLSQILKGRIIPALNNVICAYRNLRQASVDSDSDNSIHSDADYGGGEGE